MNANRLLATALCLSLAPLLGSCEKGSTPPTTTPEPAPPTAEAPDPQTPDPTGGATETGDTEPGAPSVAWKDKTFKQRQEFMGVFFLPEMKKGFKQHDEAEFARFKCQTCHGDDMKERKYEMPSDSIMGLSADDPVGNAADYNAEMTKFMVEWVVPTAAKMLEEEVADPKTQQGGFGCFECHPKE